jgi:hypothetical protein
MHQSVAALEGNHMKRKLSLILLFALLAFLLPASPAYAADNAPVAVYTFTCTGNAVLRLGPCPDGGRPLSLIQGADGNFYGTAQVSNEGGNYPVGGVVFSLTPAGTFTVVHAFAPGPARNYADGNLPGWLTQGPDGKLYGSTTYGGLDSCNGTVVRGSSIE